MMVELITGHVGTVPGHPSGLARPDIKPGPVLLHPRRHHVLAWRHPTEPNRHPVETQGVEVPRAVGHDHDRVGVHPQDPVVALPGRYETQSTPAQSSADGPAAGSPAQPHEQDARKTGSPSA